MFLTTEETDRPSSPVQQLRKMILHEINRHLLVGSIQPLCRYNLLCQLVCCRPSAKMARECTPFDQHSIKCAEIDH